MEIWCMVTHMNLINRTQANLFIQTVRGKMIASILHLVSLYPSSSLPSLFFSFLCLQWFWQMCVCFTLVLDRLGIHPGELYRHVLSSLLLCQNLTNPFLCAHSDLISSFLFNPTIHSCSPVPFVSAAVTTIQGGDTGHAARSFRQDMALGMERLDRPSNSSKEFSDHLLLFLWFCFLLLSPCGHRKLSKCSLVYCKVACIH